MTLLSYHRIGKNNVSNAFSHLENMQECRNVIHGSRKKAGTSKNLAKNLTHKESNMLGGSHRECDKNILSKGTILKLMNFLNIAKEETMQYKPQSTWAKHTPKIRNTANFHNTKGNFEAMHRKRGAGQQWASCAQKTCWESTRNKWQIECFICPD